MSDMYLWSVHFWGIDEPESVVANLFYASEGLVEFVVEGPYGRDVTIAFSTESIQKIVNEGPVAAGGEP
jgi:hypothetical protein